MIKSMTGYGDASGQINDVAYSVEIKTLNNRYLKTTVKLGDAIAFIEEDIDRILRQSFLRGTVTCAVKLANGAGSQLFEINRPALARYAEQLKSFAGEHGLPCSLDLAALLSLPGVLSTAMPEEKQALLGPAILESVGKAVENVNAMRAREGAALAEDVAGNSDAVADALEAIARRAPATVAEYREKLKRRVDELLAAAKLDLDSETLAREVAIYADRSDISEEIARLRSHLKQFADTCEKDSQAGRKLDFITQEMLREANTIGSKSSDPAIAAAVVEIKCRIDRLKEQVQNVE